MRSTVSRDSVRRVLIYRLGSLGDTVVALPALRLVARAFPQADRRMLTSLPPNAKAPASSAVLEHTGLVHGYFAYAYGTRNPFALLRLWWQLLRWRPEVLVYLSADRSPAAAQRDVLFCRMAGVGSVVGSTLRPHLALTKSAQLDLALGEVYEHESERLVRSIEELGSVDLDDAANWNLNLTTAERSRARAMLGSLSGGGFIALCLGTKNQANEWGQQNWRDLLQEIALRYQGLGLVICGAAIEAEMSEFARTIWLELSASPALNLCGRLTPRESAAVFEQAKLVLGHDSGPIHLAAAVQTTCVAVYSGRNLPGIWFPYGHRHRVLYHDVSCRGCRLSTCVVEKKRCIMSISVGEVLEQVSGVLELQTGYTGAVVSL